MKKGQTSLVMLLIIAMAFIFYAFELNIGKLAGYKITVWTAANMAASQVASNFASYGERVLWTNFLNKDAMETWDNYDWVPIPTSTHGDGTIKACEDTMLWFKILVLVIVIVITAITLGSTSWLLVLVISVVLAASLLIEQLYINPLIMAQWNKLLQNMEPLDQFREQGVQTGIMALVTDSVNVPDRFDLNGNGIYGFNPSVNWSSNDTISRFSVFYRERLKLIAPQNPFIIPDSTSLAYNNFRSDLNKFVHNPATDPSLKGLGYNPYCSPSNPGIVTSDLLIQDGFTTSLINEVQEIFDQLTIVPRVGTPTYWAQQINPNSVRLDPLLDLTPTSPTIPIMQAAFAAQSIDFNKLLPILIQAQDRSTSSPLCNPECTIYASRPSYKAKPLGWNWSGSGTTEYYVPDVCLACTNPLEPCPPFKNPWLSGTDNDNLNADNFKLLYTPYLESLPTNAILASPDNPFRTRFGYDDGMGKDSYAFNTPPEGPYDVKRAKGIVFPMLSDMKNFKWGKDPSPPNFDFWAALTAAGVTIPGWTCTPMNSSCVGPTSATACTNQNLPLGGTCAWADCSTITSQPSCLAASGCSWSAGASCAPFNYSTCSANAPACTYSSAVNCESFFGSPCSVYQGSRIQCQVHPGCTYQSLTANCPSLTTQLSCLSNFCTWNNITGKCFGQCFGLTDDYCVINSGCYWDTLVSKCRGTCSGNTGAICSGVGGSCTGTYVSSQTCTSTFAQYPDNATPLPVDADPAFCALGLPAATGPNNIDSATGIHWKRGSDQFCSAKVSSYQKTTNVLPSPPYPPGPVTVNEQTYYSDSSKFGPTTFYQPNPAGPTVDPYHYAYSDCTYMHDPATGNYKPCNPLTGTPDLWPQDRFDNMVLGMTQLVELNQYMRNLSLTEFSTTISTWFPRLAHYISPKCTVGGYPDYSYPGIETWMNSAAGFPSFVTDYASDINTCNPGEQGLMFQWVYDLTNWHNSLQTWLNTATPADATTICSNGTLNYTDPSGIVKCLENKQTYYNDLKLCWEGDGVAPNFLSLPGAPGVTLPPHCFTALSAGFGDPTHFITLPSATITVPTSSPYVTTVVNYDLIKNWLLTEYTLQKIINQRYVDLNKLSQEVTDVTVFFNEGITNLTTFIKGPNSTTKGAVLKFLEAKKKQGAGSGVTGVNGTLARLPSFIIYGWKDNTQKLLPDNSLYPGFWHIARMEIRQPNNLPLPKDRKEGGGGIFLWDMLDEQQCYVMDNSNGDIYTRATRWDESRSASNTSSFRNNKEIWNFNYSTLEDAATRLQLSNKLCAGITNPADINLIMSSPGLALDQFCVGNLGTNNVIGLSPQYIAGLKTAAVTTAGTNEQAQVLTCNPVNMDLKDTLNREACDYQNAFMFNSIPPNANQNKCWCAANIFLNRGNYSYASTHYGIPNYGKPNWHEIIKFNNPSDAVTSGKFGDLSDTNDL